MMAGFGDDAVYSEAQVRQALNVTGVSPKNNILKAEQMAHAQKVLALTVPEQIMESENLQIDEFMWYARLHQQADSENGNSFNTLLQAVGNKALKSWGSWLASTFG